MSASVNSNTSFNSRRSAAHNRSDGGSNYRSDGRSNYRSDRTNLLDNSNDIQFVFGRPDQAQVYIHSIKNLADYAGTTMNNNMYKLVTKKVEATFPKPKPPGKDPAKHVLDEHRELMKRKFDKEEKYSEDKAKLFRIIMTRCSPEMKDKLGAQSKDLNKLEDDSDVIGLLNMIKDVVYNAGGVRNKFVIMQSVNRSLYGRGTTQRPNESLNDYGQRFLQQVEVVEAVWGKLVPPCHENDSAKDQESARNQYLASLFLGGTDLARYKAAVDELNNNYVLGKDVYPADVPTAIMVLTNRRGYGGPRRRQAEDISDGLSVVSFAQPQDKVKCYNCNKFGHIARKCPEGVDGKARRGGTDDNGSVGGNDDKANWNGKTAWNFSQVQEDVKWQSLQF